MKGLHTACVAGDIVPYVVTLSAVCIQFAGTDRISTYLFMDYTPQVQHPIYMVHYTLQMQFVYSRSQQN